MRKAVSERMALEVADWRHSGLIDDATAALLSARYATRGSMFSAALKWLGLFAVFQLGLSVLAFIAASADSLTVSFMLLTLGSAGVGWWGVRLATDPLGHYPVTGNALVTLALAGAVGALVLLLVALGLDMNHGAFTVVLLLSAAIAGLVGYRFALRWPLLLALLLAFHGLGAWHAYAGSGGYFAHIVAPELMAPIAAVVAVIGLWHEHVVERTLNPRVAGFGHLYVVIGLIYTNIPLWFLSLEWQAKEWVLAFTAVAVAQIVAGARLKDSRLTGFGIVFLEAMRFGKPCIGGNAGGTPDVIVDAETGYLVPFADVPALAGVSQQCLAGVPPTTGTVYTSASFGTML